MRRREFVAGLAGAIAVPRVGRAQQAAKPVIGWLITGALEDVSQIKPALHRGLAETGHVESRNLAFEYRSAEYHFDRLPALATELVRRPVAVIFASTLQSILAAKAATQAIPIVFVTSADPVTTGIVASLNRPGGNVTGFTSLGTGLAAKRLELLHELVPTASPIAVLVNPTSPLTDGEMREVRAAAGILGVRLLILNATLESDLETAFATLAQEHAGALLVSEDALFSNHFDRLIALAARHAVPTVYAARGIAMAGGLMSYGGSGDVFRQAGAYIGRILKGERPADLPVQQATKIEMVINLKTAKALGLTFPITLLGRADEVIE
jgi:putative ABC transport system substrate-binding protein